MKRMKMVIMVAEEHIRLLVQKKKKKTTTSKRMKVKQRAFHETQPFSPLGALHTTLYVCCIVHGLLRAHGHKPIQHSIHSYTHFNDFAVDVRSLFFPFLAAYIFFGLFENALCFHSIIFQITKSSGTNASCLPFYSFSQSNPVFSII